MIYRKSSIIFYIRPHSHVIMTQEKPNSVALEGILRRLDEISIGKSVEIGSDTLIGAERVFKGRSGQQVLVHVKPEGFLDKMAVMVNQDEADSTIGVIRDYAERRGITPVDGIYQHRP